MKRILILLCLPLLFTTCKKEEEETPNSNTNSNVDLLEEIIENNHHGSWQGNLWNNDNGFSAYLSLDLYNDATLIGGIYEDFTIPGPPQEITYLKGTLTKKETPIHNQNQVFTYTLFAWVDTVTWPSQDSRIELHGDFNIDGGSGWCGWGYFWSVQKNFTP